MVPLLRSVRVGRRRGQSFGARRPSPPASRAATSRAAARVVRPLPVFRLGSRLLVNARFQARLGLGVISSGKGFVLCALELGREAARVLAVAFLLVHATPSPGTPATASGRT